MKKVFNTKRLRTRILSLLLAVVLVAGMLPQSAIVSAASTTINQPACDKNCNTELVSSHNDECAVKVYYRDLYTNSTAQELYSLWGDLSADAQDYILNQISWNDQTKRAELVALLEGGESTATPTPTPEPEVPTPTPNVPTQDQTIPGTLNGQELTVSGNLPVGATVSAGTVENESAILAEMGIESGFVADIKILDADGNEWQPKVGEKITITMKTENTYSEIIHFLDNVDAIVAGIENGSVEQMTVPAEMSDGMRELLAPAITAWQNATENTEEAVAVEIISDITVDETNGIIAFGTSGFSVYTGSAGTGEISGGISMSTYNGKTLYVTPNSTVTLTGRSKVGTGYFSSDVTEHSWTTEQGTLSAKTGSPVILTIGDLAPGTEFKVSDEYSYSSWGSTQKDTDTITFIIVPAVTFIGNGGTVDANNQETYVFGAVAGTTFTLPTATRDGYYFDGWYTAAEGGTIVGVRDDGASVSNGHLVYNYTVTGNVTLYAHWSERAEVSGYTNVIEIGLVNAYYMDSKYVINGTSYPSLGKFPKEPAVVEHPKQGEIYSVYRVDNSNGDSYSLNNEGFYPLVGSPSDYIDESIMDSTLLQTTVSGNNEASQGLADETGALVRQFLKPGALNETELIRAWLTRLIGGDDWFAAETISNLEKEFGITLPEDAANLTDEHISEFNIIPYVVKRHVQRYGNISTWIIDIIVAPANYYKLTYNMSPPAGYTSPVGGWDAVETYKEGTTADVHSGPPDGYVLTNGNYTAEFLYWTDEYGNQYGAGYDLDILMDSDKVLTAYWKTNEKDPGSLKVTKKVTAVDGNLLPDETPAFTFTYTIDKTKLIDGATNSNGSYSYKIYNAAGIEQSSGTKSLETDLSGTFDLWDGWYIIIDNLPAGAKVTVAETVVPPYIPDPSSLTMTIHAVQETSATFLNAYPRVYYTVEHYLKNSDGTYTLKNTEQLVGTVGEPTEATAITARVGYEATYPDYVGYTAKAFDQVEKISADGSTVVKIYYDPSPYTLTVNHYEVGTTNKVADTETKTVYYGQTITSADHKKTITNYQYVSASPESVVVDGNEIINLYYERKATEYTVKHFKQNLDGTYTEVTEDAQTLPGLAGTLTAAAANTYAGYTAQTFEQETIAENGSTVVEIYYNRNSYNITVNHLEKGTDTVLLNPTTHVAVYGETITSSKYKEAIENYTYVSASPETVVVDGNEVINLYYNWQVGDLKIVKTVSGEDAPDEEFTFTVTLHDPNHASQYSVVYTGTKTSTVEESVVDGKLTIKLHGGDAATIQGLPVGEYTITEAAVVGFESKFGGETTSAGNGAVSTTATVTAGGETTVTCTNTYPVYTGNLTVKKVVDKAHTNDTLPADLFDFTVTLKPDAEAMVMARPYSYKIYKADGTTTTGSGSVPKEATTAEINFQLQAGWRIEIVGLPVGTYEVVESIADSIKADYTDPAYDSNKANTITAGYTFETTVTNTYKRHRGNLQINKTVNKEYAGDAWPADTMTFTFTVAGTNVDVPDGKYNVTIGSQTVEATVSSKTLTMQDVTINITADANEATLTNSILIKDLPVGDYTVTEQDTEGFTLSAQTPSNGAVTVPASDTPVAASFTNTFDRLVGDLKITKKIQPLNGAIAPTKEKFTFTVKLIDSAYQDGEYQVTYTGTNSATTLVKATNGVLTLMLADNESVVIHGLPVGSYEVEEAAKTGFGGTFEPVSEAAAVAEISTSGATTTAAVTAGAETSVTCTNLYPLYTGSLKVTKTVSKTDENDILPADKFSITVTFTPESAAVAEDREYSYTIYDASNNKVANGSGTGTITADPKTHTTEEFKLQNGWYVVIQGVPVGGYTVEETLITTQAAHYDLPGYENQVNKIVANQTAEATVKNQYKKHVGDLQITKTVKPEDSDDPWTGPETFTFDVTATVTWPDGQYSFPIGDTGKTVSGTVSSGKLTISNVPVIVTALNTATSVLIKDLPAATYTVTEVEKAGYTLVGDNDKTAAIGVAQTEAASVSFENTFNRLRGNLEISKTVNKEYSGDAWSGDTFTFTVTPGEGAEWGADTEYVITYADGTKGSVAPVNGVLTVSIAVAKDKLNTAQTITIEGLPIGKYVVTEKTVDGYTLESTNGQETELTTAQNGTAAFTNTFDRVSGDLQINKTVTKENPNDTWSNTTFTFTVTPVTGVTLDTNRTYAVTDADGKDAGNATLSNNVLTVQIAFTEIGTKSVVIKDLPIGNYTVTETNIPTGFSLTSKNNKEMRVNATDTVIASFENKMDRKTGNLQINKTVKKAYDNDKWTKGTFTFTLTPGSGITLDADGYTIKDGNGSTLTTVKPTGNVLTVEIEVKALDTAIGIVIENLPTGSYTVTETLQDDYTLTAEEGKTEAQSASKAVTVTDGTTKSVSYLNTYKRHLGTLVITKTVDNWDKVPVGEYQSFVFRVTGNGVDMDVVIPMSEIVKNDNSQGTASVIINDLPLGTYQVVEDTSWSWRFDCKSASLQTATLQLTDLSKEVSFENSYKPDNKWLNFVKNVINTFTASSAATE